jgi:hypothetical protein
LSKPWLQERRLRKIGESIWCGAQWSSGFPLWS